MLSYDSTDSVPTLQEQDCLPPMSRWAILGGLLLVGAIGVAATLATVIQYKTVVKAQASVRPAGELRVVQATTDGQIMQITVKENQPVKTGDVIAMIDDSRLQTRKSQLQSDIQQSKLQLLQINAQIRALESQILAEAERTNRAHASAQAEFDLTQRDYQDRQRTTAAEVGEAKANLRSAEAAFIAAQSKQQRYQPIAAQGAIAQEQLAEAQLEAQQRRQDVEAAKARLQRAQTALNPSRAEVAIATERIAQEKATGLATHATLNREREALIQQRIQLQKELERNTQERQQVDSDLHKTTIIATAEGVISKMHLRNPGQTVRSGAEIAQIAPSNTQLVVKALVAAQDISKVTTGQTTQLRVSACPYPDYGTLNGVVSTISPDTLSSQVPGPAAVTTTASTQGENTTSAFYEVTIQPDRHSLGRGANQCPIQLGMKGKADIVSREETVLKFLLRQARLVSDL